MSKTIKLTKSMPLQPLIDAVTERCEENPLGVEVYIETAEPGSSDDQRKGWHWLLGQWLEMDPGIAVNGESLKSKVLIAMWGAAKVIDQYGNIGFMPMRRTTQYWDWDREPAGYRRKKLTRKLYTDLVDFTYDMAGEDGIELPLMKKDYLHELEPRERWRRVA